MVILDVTTPTVRVLFPNGGERLQPNQIVTIQWTSTDNIGVVAHDVKFSATGAEPFTDIATNLPGAQQSFNWIVPNTLTSQGAIRVVARDAAGNQGGDRSDATFTIAQVVPVPAPVISEVSPPSGPAQRNGGPAQVAKVLGMSFQPGARVFFGTPEARVTANAAQSLTVEVPESTATGPVTVRVVNPDNQEGRRTNAFTYLGARQAVAARVSGVRPLTVLENSETNFEIMGRNLATALAQGVVAIRVPRGVTIEMKSTVSVATNPAAQQDTLSFRAIVRTSSPLDPLDRLVLTVVASVRPLAAGDNLHESSRATFTVVGAASPIPIAFTAKLKKGGPNVVLLAGRGLADADVSIEHGLGDQIQASAQRGDDELAGILVTVAPDAADGPVTLVLRKRGGDEIGRYPLAFQPVAPGGGGGTSTALATPSQPAGDPRVAELSQVPGQRVLTPTAGNIMLFDLRTLALRDGTPNLDKASNANLAPGVRISRTEVSTILPIIDLVRLFPLFDEGGETIDESAFTGVAGVVLGVRALSLTIVVQVNLLVTRRIAVFLDVDPFLDTDFPDPFNEFESELPMLGGPVFGALAIEIREEISVTLQILFYVAVVLPTAQFRFLASFGLNLTIADGGRRLSVGLGRSVRVTAGRFGPAPLRPELADRLLLISPDPKPDALGLGVYGYYFPTAPGKVCVDFDYNMKLFETDLLGRESLVFELFRPTLCFFVKKAEARKTYRIVPGPVAVTRGSSGQVQLVAQTRDKDDNPVGGETPVPAGSVEFRPDTAADGAFFSAARPGGTGEWQVTGVANGSGKLDALLRTSAGKGLTVLPTPGLRFVFLAETEKPRPVVAGTQVNVAAQVQPALVTVAGSLVIGDPRIPATLATLQVSPTDSKTGDKIRFMAGGVTTDLLTLDPTDPTFEIQIPTDRRSGNEAVFSGFLIVRAKWMNGTAAVDKTVRMPVFARQNRELEPYRAVLLNPRNPGEERYLFVKPTLSEGGLPVAARGTLVTAIRDQVGVRANYQATIEQDDRGMVSHAGRQNVLFGLPITETALVRWQPTAGAHFLRSDFLRFTAEERAAQLQSNALLVRTSPAVRRAGSAAGRTILLDPGHGVNYEGNERRVHEWYPCSRICRRVAELWKQAGGETMFVPTAGFKVSSKVAVRVDLAGFTTGKLAHKVTAPAIILTLDPRTGVFEWEAAAGTTTLKTLGDFIGYAPADGVTDPAVIKQQRERFLTESPRFFDGLVRRILDSEGAEEVPGTRRWIEKEGRTLIQAYFVDILKRGGQPERQRLDLRGRVTGAAGTVQQRGDFVTLTPGQRDKLAEASILFSYKNESEPRFRAFLGGETGPDATFLKHAKEVLLAEGRSLDVTARLDLLTNLIPQLKPVGIVTVHQNATPGGSGLSLLLPPNIAELTPNVRTAKRYVKYVDPLGNGKLGSGLKFNDALLPRMPPSASLYAFMEIDFMDTLDNGVLRYKKMVENPFIEAAAQQIVGALAEIAVSPQPDAELDAASIGAPEP
jgi:hypothetical protein